MRLQNVDNQRQCDDLREFLEWISSIGDGVVGGPNDGNAMIDIPDDILLTNSDNAVVAIVDSTYPNLSGVVDDTSYLKGRATLAPTLDVVDSINEYMVSRIESDARTYLSNDATCKSESNIDLLQDLHTPEFLNGIRCFGVPNHMLMLNVGIPVTLLRNMDHSIDMCNGTRFIIAKLGNHVIEAKILTENNARDKVFIPSMTLTPSET